MAGDEMKPPAAVAPATLEVIQFQVGQLQASVDRGLASLERTQERGIDELKDSLRKQGDRLGSIEQTLVKHTGKIEALETFRREQEERDEQTYRRAVDESATARIWRVMVVVGIGVLTVAGTVMSILAATGAFR